MILFAILFMVLGAFKIYYFYALNKEDIYIYKMDPRDIKSIILMDGILDLLIGFIIW